MNQRNLGIVSFLSALIFITGCVTSGQKISTVTPSSPTVSQPAAADIEALMAQETVKVKIETTLGDIQLELFAKEAPRTVKNFVTLAQKGFYDGIIFHRVIPGFMIQTGDPTGTGMGGPGYQFEDEFNPKLRHDNAGTVSMANAGPNTNGSQFFITDAATPWLDGRHSVFGRVISGLDIVHQIANVDRGANDKPIKEVAMKKVSVIA